jgi:hypothetical protein
MHGRKNPIIDVFNARLKVLTSSHPDDMHLLGDQITKKHHPVIQIEKDLNVSFVRTVA